MSYIFIISKIKKNIFSEKKVLIILARSLTMFMFKGSCMIIKSGQKAHQAGNMTPWSLRGWRKLKPFNKNETDRSTMILQLKCKPSWSRLILAALLRSQRTRQMMLLSRIKPESSFLLPGGMVRVLERRDWKEAFVSTTKIKYYGHPCALWKPQKQKLRSNFW